MFFVLPVSVPFDDPLPSLYRWAGASTPSANEPAKDLSLVHTVVQLKPMIKPV